MSSLRESLPFGVRLSVTDCMLSIHTYRTHYYGILLPSADVAFDKKNLTWGNYQDNKSCKPCILSPDVCTRFGFVWWYVLSLWTSGFFCGTMLTLIMQDHTSPLYFCGTVAVTSISFHPSTEKNCLPWKLKTKRIKKESWDLDMFP